MISVIVQSILVFIILCLTVLYLYLRTNYGYWKRRGVPYEEPTMLFGTLGGLMRTSMFDLMYNLSKKHKNKDYLGIFLGWKPTLLINSNALAKNVLVKDFDSFQNRHTFAGGQSDPLGALNLFTVKALFSMYTSDTVGYSVFGLRVSALKDLTSPLWHITQHMARWTFWRGLEFSIIFFSPGIARIMRLKFFSEPATDYVTRMFKEVVEQRKKVEGAHASKDLVNHLLKINYNLKLPANSDPQLAENLVLAQVAVFILGSIETSSSTLSFLLHELAYHPEKQEKLYEEISKARQEKGKDVLEFSDLLELNYLTACIKGKRYGITQVRTAVAHIMMKYKFEPAAPYIIKIDPYSIVVGPKSGGKVKFIPR